MEPAETRYLAREHGLLAYQVLGEGHDDAVFLAEINQHLDLSWSEPHVHALMERIGAVCRLAFFQPRGIGLSDPTPSHPTLEEQADDVLAVMDAVGMAQAVLAATFTTAGAAALVAARAPHRVRGIVMFNPIAQGMGAADLVGWAPEEREPYLAGWAEVFQRWGSGLSCAMWDAAWGTAYNRRLFALLERVSASPATAQRFFDWVVDRYDVTDVLRQVRVPTRVLRVPGNSVPEAAVRYVAELVPGATYVRLPPTPTGASIGEHIAPLFDHVEQMLMGSSPVIAGVRMGSVLFTDVVASTELLARLGDHAYNELRADHERQVRVAVDRYGGELHNVAGDGTVSLFEGTSRALQCGLAVCSAARELGLQVRAGAHTGELERTQLSLSGLTVHIAARVMAQAAPGQLLVTRATRDLAGDDDDLVFTEESTVPLRGVPGDWALWSVSRSSEPVASADPPRPTALDRVAVGTVRRAPRVARALVRLGNAVQRRALR